MTGIEERKSGPRQGAAEGPAGAAAGWGGGVAPVDRLLSLLLRLPLSGPILGAAIRFHHRRGRGETAARLALAGLRRYRNGRSPTAPKGVRRRWWRFLGAAVEALEDRWHDELRSEILHLAAPPLPPAEGPEAARPLLGLARWKSDARDYEGAHELAGLAAEADPDWAEPDFLLGWCGLLLARMDAADLLGRAVDKDHRMLFRIVNDPICKRRPHIAAALKKRSLAGGLVIEAEG